jgi:hypothetical protein
MDRIDLAPRREAQNFSWKDLDNSQKNAYIKAISLIEHYINSAQTSESNDSYIQKNRQSQIIFIDGNRGTGKTSLLTTLVHSTSSRTNSEQFINEITTKNSLDKILLNVFKKEMLDSICWLPILDLEMLPEPTNLLASLCVRIEDAFKTLDIQPYKSTRIVEKPERNTWRNFSDIMHDFALGWKTNLPERRASDPDTYSSEVLRVERARIKLVEFPQIMSDLGAMYKKSQKDTRFPLFILPVDDADLNPQRFLDLLDLTRRAKSTNLLYLVLGKYENIAQLLEWKYAGEITALLPSKEIVSMPGKYLYQMEEYSTHWAYSALQKLIPTGNHLIELKEYSSEEGGNHKPQGCRYSLKELLIFTEIPNRQGKIKDYFEPHSNLWEFITLTTWKRELPYKSQLETVLSGPIRSIENLSRDLVGFLNDLPIRPETLSSVKMVESILSFVKKHFEGALLAEPGLPYIVREKFKQLFYPTGSIPDLRITEKTIVVKTGRLSIQHDASDAHSRSSNLCSYIFRQCDGFYLHLPNATSMYTDNSSSIKKDFYNLTDWRANWILLFHDLNLLYPANTIERFDFSDCTQHWAESGLYLDSSPSLILSIPWPCPNWLLFNHLEMFRIFWDNAVNENEFVEFELEKRNHLKRNYHLEFAAYLWCVGIYQIIIGSKKIFTPKMTDFISKDGVLWTKLVEAMLDYIEKKGGVSDLRKRYMLELIESLFLLMTPEFGIFKQMPFNDPTNPSSVNVLKKLYRYLSAGSIKSLRVKVLMTALVRNNLKERLDIIKAISKSPMLKRHWMEKTESTKIATVLIELCNRNVTENLVYTQHQEIDKLKAEIMRELDLKQEDGDSETTGK